VLALADEVIEADMDARLDLGRTARNLCR